MSVTSIMFYTTALLLAAIGLMSCPLQTWAASAERAGSERPVVHQRRDANSKTDDTTSASRLGEVRGASPFEDLDRKFEAERRKIKAAITICRC
jgi:hypothetical protein